jgi:hypothetical protein
LMYDSLHDESHIQERREPGSGEPFAAADG